MNDITIERIRQYVLYKHHLIDTSREREGILVKVVKDICGLHAQVPTTPFLSMRNRVEDFSKESLSRELYDKRTLVKMWGMRSTLHIIPTEQMADYYHATKRVGGRKPLQIKDEHKRVVEILDRRGPLTSQELTGYLTEFRDKKQDSDYGDVTFARHLLYEMCFSTNVIPSQPRGGWKSNLHTYVSRRTWLPSVNFQAVDELEAKKNVVQYYLSGYGPATLEDIAWWIGLTKTEIKGIIKELTGKVESIEIQGLEGEFFILSSDLAHLQDFSVDDQTVHLLPRFDPYIMGYKNRKRLISEKYEKQVYWSKRAEVSASILVNGYIVGTWNHKEEKNRLKIALSFFEEDDKAIRDKAKEQAEAVAHFLSEKEVEIVS